MHHSSSSVCIWCHCRYLTIESTVVYVFLRGDDDIHQLIATITQWSSSTLIEGIVSDGSGCVDDNVRTATAGGAAAELTHYNRQNQTETIKLIMTIVS